MANNTSKSKYGQIGWYSKATAVPAKAVAEKAGLNLVENGGAYWTDCIMPDCGMKETIYFTGGGRYNCAACDRGGDSIDFYRNLYGLDRDEAAERMANEFDAPATEEQKPEEDKKPKEPATPGSNEWNRRESNNRYESELFALNSFIERIKEQGASDDQLRFAYRQKQDLEARMEMAEHFAKQREDYHNPWSAMFESEDQPL